MKYLKLLITAVALHCTASFVHASNRLASDDSDRRLTVYCVPAGQLTYLASYYRDRIEREIGAEDFNGTVAVRFLKTSPIKVAMADEGTDIIDDDLEFTDVDGTPVLSGAIDLPTCRIAMPVSISIRRMDEFGNRSIRSSRSTVVVPGFLTVRRTNFTSSLEHHADADGVYNY